jgi:long-chain acyl-CoA synthetase
MRKDSNQPVHSDGYDRGDHEDTTTKRAMMEESAKPKGTLEKEEDVVVTPKSKRKAFWRRLANAKRRILSKMDSKSGFGVSATIAVVQIGVFIYDVLTYPIYTLLQRPWTNLAKSKRKRARVTQKDEDSVTYRSGIHMKELQLTLKDEGVTTMVGVLAHAVKTHRNKPVLGMRRLIKEEGEKQPDGRVFQKFVLGDYEWTTYNELDSMSTAFGAGLIACGQRVRHNVVILAETRSEWLVAAYGCMKYNIPIVTLYATLGEEAIAHGINETEVTHIVTSHELLPKFKKVLESTPRVTNVIYMEHQLQPSNTDGYKPGVTFTSFKDVVERGKTSPIDPAPPSPMDTAIIMYTSGSTGTPKGVVLTHSNMVASLVSFSAQLDFYPNDVYMGFLPLAHVLELLAESVCMLVGIQIGYSSPLTITDNSSKIMRGSKGDASVLRPTIMASVPLILDRIYKAIIDKVKKESAFTRAVIKFAYDYKRRWTSYGYSTPLIDKLIFKKFRGVIGGRLRGMAVGGAPLSPETQDFIKTCLSAKLSRVTV